MAGEKGTDRLSELLDKNTGSRIRHEWVAALSSIVTIQVHDADLLDISETAALKAVFFAKVKSHQKVFHRYLNKTDSLEIVNIMSQLAPRMRNEQVILFSSVDKFIGAVRLPADEVLNHYQALWNLVKEDFSIATVDAADGLCLEENFYKADGEYVKEGIYELTAWGKLVP